VKKISKVNRHILPNIRIPIMLIALLIVVSSIHSYSQSVQAPTTKVDSKDSLEYSFIPAGSFLMGCVPGDTSCWKEEKPQHRVRITKGFWMSKTEVTVKAFKKFVKETGYVPQSQRENKGRLYRNQLDDWEWTTGLTWKTPLEPMEAAQDNWPVAHVSWVDAKAYCTWVGGSLPTEAQWEYASRGGRDNELYPLGKKYENGPDEILHQQFPKMKYWQDYTDGFIFYASVGSFEPNGFGLYDMSGNVWEWCADWFAEDLFTTQERVDPIVKEKVKYKSKIIRGGAWCYSPEQHRNSERGVMEAQNFWAASIGFRCVLK
jgi:formylglycine-generating enzyme required for sulfatase activity